MPAITDLPISTPEGYEIKTLGITDTNSTTYTYSGNMESYIFRNDGGVSLTLTINGANTTVASGQIITGGSISSFTIVAASSTASWTMRAFTETKTAYRNMSGSALASAARTSTTTSADITNINKRGIIVYLNITSAPASPGSGGLKVVVYAKSKTGIVKGINALSGSPLQTSSGTTMYAFYPAAGTASFGFNLVTGGAISQTFYIEINHADSQSYTYSVDYDLVV